jgi:deoxyribodipyrimidine photo-lyase
MTSLLWLRRELRLADHPALDAALSDGEPVVPVFCFDGALLAGRHASGPRTQFLLECLADLDGALRERGTRLLVRHGPPARELATLARELGVDRVHFSADVSPFARRRQREVVAALRDAEVQAIAHPGLFAVDALEPIRTQTGEPYTVFSPFYRNWIAQPRRPVFSAPDSFTPLQEKVAVGSLPALSDLGLAQEVSHPAPGGESAAHEALQRFLDGPLRTYGDDRNGLSGDAVSRLSPYLHFGCISPRQIEQRLPDGRAAEAFRRQLCWRDFYAHVLGHHPANARSEHQARYRGAIHWSRSQTHFGAWCEGRTGYPLVDAGMRQLRREGWMHNRARLLVGSFLTKDLGIDWRWGERFFMRMLIDGDEGSNNGNWQWIASVGVDPQPAFRRIFSPARQMERFDPDGEYVRRYVAELRDVPDRFLKEPWTMPPEIQRSCGCQIGTDYPEPIVDHAQARRAALERYRIPA